MKKRHAEIVGAGFAGLTAACALAQRGWSVRVHERADRLRTTGAGIYIYENGLRVLEAVGAYDAAVQGAPFAHTREVRDGRDRLISVHRWTGSRVFSIVRQNVINALAAAATRAGVVIVTNSTATGATAEGELLFADGSNVKADLIVGADGSNSRLRDSLGLLSKRKYLVDGCIRLLLDKTEAERAPADGAKTIEYWSGTRRLLYTPCSETDIYIALTMLDDDAAAKAVPVRKDEWKRAFPHLETLIDRIGALGALRPFRTHQAQTLVGRPRRYHRRCGARAAAEYRPGRRLRHDECAVALRLSRSRERRFGSAGDLGAQGTSPHRAHATHLLFSRPADDVAAGVAGRRTWDCRPIEMAGSAAHPHRAAPAQRAHRIEKGAGLKPAPSVRTTPPWSVRRHHHMPALISVCSVAAFAASFAVRPQPLRHLSIDVVHLLNRLIFLIGCRLRVARRAACGRGRRIIIGR